MLDHLIWGASDLEEAMEAISRKTGVRPRPGGRHVGLGTRNALLSLGQGCYFEILAPDPAQTPLQGWARDLSDLETPRFVSWVARTDDIEALAGEAKARGYPLEPIRDMSRQKKDGSLLTWRFAFVEGYRLHPVVPAFIEWTARPHPSVDAPSGCVLRELAIEAVRPQALSPVFAALGIEIPIRAASRDGLRVVLDAPLGRVDLT